MKKLPSLVLPVLLAQTCPNAQGADALFEGPLPPLPPEQEVVIEEITLPPGHVGRPHRHDAHVYVYVVEGAVDMQVEGAPVTRVSAGEVFVEGPDDIHAMNNNASATEPARFVAFIIKAADAPVVLPVEPRAP